MAAMLFLAFPGALLAQETAPDDAAGSEAAGSAGASYSEVTKVFDKWSFQCMERAGQGRCYVETVIRQNKPKVRDVVALRLSQIGDAVEASVSTPNGVKLDRGVSLVVGEETISTNYAVCGPESCTALLAQQDALTGLMREQNEMAVVFHVFASPEDGGEREIKIPVSLAGFASAYEQLVVSDANQ
jgi:invasion protein IalB